MGNPDLRYPVLYWLHGLGDGAGGVPVLSQFFRQAMEEGMLPNMFVVFVNGLPEGMYVDSKNGRSPLESMIIQDLLPDVDERYRILVGKRILEGFSMGGYGASRLGFKFPDLFVAVSNFAGGPMHLDFTTRGPVSLGQRIQIFNEIYGGNQSYFEAQNPIRLSERNTAKLRTKPAYRMVVGSNDSMVPFNREFHFQLQDLAIPHQWKIIPGIGDETLPLLRGMKDEYGAFIRDALYL